VPDDTDPEVIALSELLNALPIHTERPDENRFRNPNGVALKLANLRALDQPGHGMSRGGRRDEEVWNEFSHDGELLHRTAEAIRVGFVTLNEGIDTSTPAGKLQLHILSAIAEFERERIRERVVAGLQRARSQGKRLGRPRTSPSSTALTVRDATKQWGVSKSTAARWMAKGTSGMGQTPPNEPRVSP
jgi:hypothetical protein